MYNTDNYQNGYCHLYHSYRKHDLIFQAYGIIVLQEIVTYCFRSTEENNSTKFFDFQNNIHPGFTFNKLREKNITSQILLSWSASIDTAEQYQIFLNNYPDLSSEKDQKFYNCTSSWFGSFCQFTFDDQSDQLFEEILLSVSRLKSTDHDSVKITCYKHLTCQTLVSCLDWREICDGKRNCIDGSDEANCWQLEVNECNDNEYRCHNGQCIPIEFLHDTWYEPDCIDGTDEDLTETDLCYKTPSFECEEHTCLEGDREFPCGDGECANEISPCQNGRNRLLINTLCSNATTCSMKYEFLDLPLLFGHVRFIMEKENSKIEQTILPIYICYDVKLCGEFLPHTVQFDNLTCRNLSDFGLSNMDLDDDQELFISNIKSRFRGCLSIVNETHYCNYSTIYQCENSSKCISKYRLLDGIQDCPFNDDETFNESCSLKDSRHRFKCYGQDNEKCFTSSIIRNGKIECKNGDDEYDKKKLFARTHISFEVICTGRVALLPVFIDGQNETDETGCEPWQCNNTHSRCDGFWLCKNGADEIGCRHSSICSHDYHECVFPNDTSKISCLPIARIGDDIDDCLGVTDEQTKYRVREDYIVDDSSLSSQYSMFHCRNDPGLVKDNKLCNGFPDCRFKDDEIFCKNNGSNFSPRCENFKSLTDVEKFLCHVPSMTRPRPKEPIAFALLDVMTYPSELVTYNTSVAMPSKIKDPFIEKDRKDNLLSDLTWWCNRGVPIYVRMYNNTSTLSCLCPPSYYGDQCQYQNQRVSLTIQIQAASDWNTMFIFFITLIDNDRNIQSHNHIDYLPIRDCKIKSSIYLIYSTRPKNLLKNYSVQIDVFNQVTWHYRASWIFPLRFPFLPVHRLAVLLRVPFSNIPFVRQQCSPSCIHGQCFHYVNDQKSTFCRCEHGWSGVQCNIQHKCDCAPNSLCISTSICLCPVGRFGRRCHLFQSLCHSKSCMNGGLCVPADARYTLPPAAASVCICPEGFVGQRCQLQQQRQTQIDISFHSSLTIPSSLLVHFIATQDLFKKQHNRTSIARKIQFDQQSLTLYTPTWFNIAIAQISTQYYLIILRQQTIKTVRVSTKIIPSHRCQSISELFNDTFAKVHLLKRIKYYHLLCQQHHGLVCFRDEVHICLCTLNRVANCFEFDHNMTYDCDKYKYCGDNGNCFQDDLICPTSSFCACDQCYFGSRCQLSTKGSTLSLDTILGYHIRSNTGISQQSIIIKVAIALTILMFIVGCVNSFLTFQTFRSKQTRNVGCGLYLFTLSIVSIMTAIVLSLKFTFFLTSQIGSINNHSFLLVQCRSMDFFLRFLLSTNDWLSACVAIERAINVIQGVKFNKTKSKQIAKWIILIVLLFTSCTYIYDPLHRHLEDDKEEQRTWCLTQYSSSVQLFDWLLNIFHFSIPFAINCISALIVIIIAARTRSNSQKTKSFKEHLREQLHHHKHLLISPMILVSLAMPRLVISFLSGCMKSAQDSWLYLIGYFISFIPSIMTFIVFVLPSDIYKKAFSETMKQMRSR